MRFISWNVNGLRACIGKGFQDFFDHIDADFFCLQETKLHPGQINLDLKGYEQFWCYAEKKGYSGTAIFTKHPPLSVFTASTFRQWTPRGESLRWNIKISILSPAIPLMHSGNWHGLTIEWHGRMLFWIT